MMIEQNTNYAYKLKYMDNPTFDKVRDLSTKFYRELPQALQDELFEALNRGIDILDSEPQMTAYLFAFGKMHQAKLNYAFGKLPKEFLEQLEINIIDYGCGQALGTMCYADFLRENGYSQKVKTITLIEPSEICLKRAALNASAFFHNAEIKTANKKFYDLTQDDIVCSEETPTLHILSNVLDMLNFNLERFAELVKGCLKGYNQFVCAGPYFNYAEKDNRMEDFCSLLNGKKYFRASFDRYEFEEDKAWTAQICCSSVCVREQLNMSTELSKDDLYLVNNCIGGISNVIYSKDGIRLLHCQNPYLQNYTVIYGTKIICDYAFEDREIRQIDIPNSVEIIGNGAFSLCALQSLIIPKSVRKLGHMAFSCCFYLTQITISSSDTSFEKDTFCDCDSLQQIIIPKGSTEKFKRMLDKELWDKLVEE